jgi:hypothetical protein
VALRMRVEVGHDHVDGTAHREPGDASGRTEVGS